MDPGWDHTENEDKHLLTQVIGLSTVNDTQVAITGVNTTNNNIGGSTGTTGGGGCSSGSQELVSLSGEYNKQLSSVVLNKVNRIHIFLYDLIPTNLSYLSNTLSKIDSLIKFCQNILHQSVNNISSDNNLFNNICKLGISDSHNCLEQIKPNLQKLHQNLLDLHGCYGSFRYLKNEAEKIVKCDRDVSGSDSKISRLIQAFNCSLSEFAEIECLVISAKSIIYEITTSKNQLMVLTSGIPSEDLKSVYFKIKSWSSKIDRITSSIHDVEIHTWCLKYWICKFISVSNANQNSLSSLNVQYIGYFYHVFPLHLNTYRRLFGDVIRPKLLQLTKSVSGFTGLTCEIDSFKCRLEGVSIYLKNVNPADELLNLINTFDGKSYVDSVRTHIQPLIDELSNKFKYQQIITHLNSLAIPYNRNLDTRFKSFKKDIEKHKKSLEQNIKEYIKKINSSLTQHISCVQKLINKFWKDIKILESNNSKLDEFTRSNGKIAKPCTTFQENGQKNSYKKIFETHEEYKKCLTKCYWKINFELKKFTRILRRYNYNIQITRNSLCKYNDSLINWTNIDEIVKYLNSLKKKYTDKFDGHMESVEKLEKIGKHIKTMKDTLKEVEGKVKPEAANYINGLAGISIKECDIKSNIEKIKDMNSIIIGKLQIAKHTIDLYRSLEDEIKKLDEVKFYHHHHDNQYIDYLNHEFSMVKSKVESFKKEIESKHCESKREIEEIKKKNGKVTKEGLTCDDNKLQEDDNDPISDVKTCMDGSVEEIKKFIDNSLNVIRVIQYLLPRLENNKNESGLITEIQSKVCGINELIDATTKLTGARDKLKEFVKLQERSKSLIDTFKLYQKFTTLGRYSNELQDYISLSYGLIGLMELSIKHLNGITKVDYLIRWIKRCYESRFKKIETIIQNFKGYVRQISNRLGIINSNLCLIKTLSCQKSIQNNLLKLREYMVTLKVYVRNIRRSFNGISGVIDKIKLESSYFPRYKRELEGLEKYIQCYINWIKCNNKNVLKESVEKQLEEIKDRLNDTITILNYIIDFRTIPKCIKEIELRLKSVESSVDKLECAIEGVPRNLIRCSLQSITSHTIHSSVTGLGVGDVDNTIITNYSMMNVGEYGVVVNRMLEFWTFSDEAVELFTYVRFCLCALNFESQYQRDRPSTFPYGLPSIKTTDLNPVSELRRDTMAENVGNHLCLCLVIKYHLRPSLLKCILFLRNEELGPLDTISRKYDGYNKFTFASSDLWKLCALALNIIYEITSFLRNRYNFVWIRSYYPSEIKCFCTIANTIDYHPIVSIMLVISSIVENMWTMDSESIRLSIECLSCMLSEFEKIDPYNNKSSTTKIELDIVDKIMIGSYHVSQLSIGLIFESLKFLGYYFKSIIALLPTQTLRVTLFWQYLFNIVFSLDNFPNNIINLYNILEFSFDTVLSNFILIPELLCKFINGKDYCKCKNKICSRRILIALSTKVVYYKIIWVKKNILNNNRLYSIKESKNSLIIMIINCYFNYNKLGVYLVKNHLLTNHKYPTNINVIGNMGLKDASSTNWGYDAS